MQDFEDIKQNILYNKKLADDMGYEPNNLIMGKEIEKILRARGVEPKIKNMPTFKKDMFFWGKIEDVKIWSHLHDHSDNPNRG